MFTMLSRLAAIAFGFPYLVYVIVALGTVWYIKNRKRTPPNIPPLPVKGWPIVGHIPMIAKKGSVKQLREWRKSTGNIFSMYMGRRLNVVMCSYPILKEAFVKNADVFSDRIKSYLGDNLGYMGIVASSGHNWKEQRSVSMQILRNFGMGKNFLTEKINEEVAFYIKALSDLNGKPTDVQILTNTSVSNVICGVLVGRRFEYDDPYFTDLIKLINYQFVLLGRVNMMNSFPWFKYVPGDWFGYKKVIQNMKDIRQHFCTKFFKETKGKKEEGAIDNFINAYNEEMDKKIKSGAPTQLDKMNLLSIMSNLFLAGTETTSTTILWVIIICIHHPDAQDKVYQEIAEHIGTERTPIYQDKKNMKYTHAFLLETLRYACIGPASLPHLCNRTIEIAGYIIPKGTTVFANLSEVMKDEKTWGDPLIFRPERFFDEDNTVKIPEEFIPFSIGRRYCMGESLAKMELFLFVTGILQRFKIEPEEPNLLPSLEPKISATNAPQNFKPRLIERN